MFRIIEMNEDFNQLKKGIKSLKPCGIFKKNRCSFYPPCKAARHGAMRTLSGCYAAALSADSMARMMVRTMPPKFRISVPCRV